MAVEVREIDIFTDPDDISMQDLLDAADSVDLGGARKLASLLLVDNCFRCTLYSPEAECMLRRWQREGIIDADQIPDDNSQLLFPGMRNIGGVIVPQIGSLRDSPEGSYLIEPCLNCYLTGARRDGVLSRRQFRQIKTDRIPYRTEVLTNWIVKVVQDNCSV